MNNIAKLGAILFAICAIAALALGLINQVTAPIIEERSIQANNEARKVVLLEASEFTQMDNNVFSNIEGLEEGLVSEVYEGKKGSEIVGYTVKTLPKGYGGKIELIVGLSKEGNITGIDIGGMSETPGLGSKVAEPAFKNQFNDKSTANQLDVVKGKASSEKEIQAISGATITSKAVTKGVNAAIEVYNSVLNK